MHFRDIAQMFSNTIDIIHNSHSAKTQTPIFQEPANNASNAGGGGRTRTILLSTDFESVTSANSITPAYKNSLITADVTNVIIS